MRSVFAAVAFVYIAIFGISSWAQQCTNFSGRWYHYTCTRDCPGIITFTPTIMTITQTGCTSAQFTTLAWGGTQINMIFDGQSRPVCFGPGSCGSAAYEYYDYGIDYVMQTPTWRAKGSWYLGGERLINSSTVYPVNGAPHLEEDCYCPAPSGY